MRWTAWLVLVACTKTEPPHSTPSGSAVQRANPAPAPAVASKGSAKDPADEGPCPKRGGPQTTAVQRIGLYVRILPHERGYVAFAPKYFKVIDDAGQQLESVDARTVPKHVIAMSTDYWFVPGCQPGGCDEHGAGTIVNRIDRKSGATLQIGGPDSEIAFAEVVGDALYWATYGPYGLSGALNRTPIAGGKTTALWTGKAVNSVLIHGATAYVADDTSVSSVALSGGAPRTLVKGLVAAHGLAVDDKYLYVTDRGDAYVNSKDSGSVLRVPLGGGNADKLAGPVRWPTVVGVDDERVYFMGDESGDVWAIPKAGGKAFVYIPTPPKDWPCRSTTWMHVGSQGLKYLRMSRGWDSATGDAIDWGTLWSIQRPWMKDPEQAFKDYVAKHPEAVRAGSADQP
jgi:hypothetical protein